MKTQQSPSFEADVSDNGMKMTTFWGIAPCKGVYYLSNLGLLQQDYTVLYS